MAYALLQDRRDAVSKWKKNNPDKVKLHKAIYRKRHRDRMVTKMRDWRKEHPVNIKQYKAREKKKLERFIFKIIVKEMPSGWLIRDMRSYIINSIQLNDSNFKVVQLRPKK